MSGRIEVAGARYTVHGMHKGEMASSVEDSVRIYKDFGIKDDDDLHRFLMKQNSTVLYGIMMSARAGRIHPTLETYRNGLQLSMLAKLTSTERR